TKASSPCGLKRALANHKSPRHTRIITARNQREDMSSLLYLLCAVRSAPRLLLARWASAVSPGPRVITRRGKESRETVEVQDGGFFMPPGDTQAGRLLSHRDYLAGPIAR